jgi:predicted RNA-binding Zn ribbon-like protein
MPRVDGQWTGEQESKPAPAPLDRIQALVNTIDKEIDQDRLAAADDAVPWLRDHGYLTSNAALADDDLAFVRDVREGLRALLVHNSGGPPPGAEHLSVLRTLAGDAALRPAIADDGGVDLIPAVDALRGALGQLLVIVRDAQRDGSWERFKACGNEACQWAFYDRSRNRGGSWCTMATCGNRLKNRDFRARSRVSSTDATPARPPAHPSR